MGDRDYLYTPEYRKAKLKKPDPLPKAKKDLNNRVNTGSSQSNHSKNDFHDKKKSIIDISEIDQSDPSESEKIMVDTVFDPQNIKKRTGD